MANALFYDVLSAIFNYIHKELNFPASSDLSDSHLWKVTLEISLFYKCVCVRVEFRLFAERSGLSLH